MIDYIKSHKAGHVICWLGLISGPIMLALTYNMLAKQGAYNSTGLGVGIFMLIMGITFLVFPGSPRRIADYPGQEVRINILLEESPKLHRIAWYVAFGISFLITASASSWLPYLMEWLGI